MESFSCRRTLRGHDDDVLSLALWGGFLFRCALLELDQYTQVHACLASGASPTQSLNRHLFYTPHNQSKPRSGSADGKIIVWRLDTLTYHRAFTSAGQSIQVGGGFIPLRVYIYVHVYIHSYVVGLTVVGRAQLRTTCVTVSSHMVLTYPPTPTPPTVAGHEPGQPPLLGPQRGHGPRLGHAARGTYPNKTCLHVSSCPPIWKVAYVWRVSLDGRLKG